MYVHRAPPSAHVKCQSIVKNRNILHALAHRLAGKQIVFTVHTQNTIKCELSWNKCLTCSLPLPCVCVCRLSTCHVHIYFVSPSKGNMLMLNQVGNRRSHFIRKQWKAQYVSCAARAGAIVGKHARIRWLCDAVLLYTVYQVSRRQNIYIPIFTWI